MGWETYKGLEVPVAPTGDAGINLKDNFKSLADRSLPADATAGSVLFVGLDGTTKIVDEDADNFSWDDTNNRLGLGTNAPLDVLQVEGDGKGLFMATGSTAGTSESFITFGAGLTNADKKMRIRFNYGTSDLYLERRDGAGVWTSVMQLSHSDGSVEIPINLSGNASTGKLQIRDGAVRQSLEVFSYYTSDTVLEGVRLKARTGSNFELGTFVGTGGGSAKGLTIGNYTGAAPDTIVPWLAFSVSGNPVFYRNQITVEAYGVGAVFAGKRANGTRDTPAKVVTGDVLTALQGYGYEDITPGFDTNASAAVMLLASEEFSDVANGTHIIFRTTTIGTATSAERMRIDNAGNIGLGTAAPTAMLDVNSEILRLRVNKTPASATAAGNKGDFCWDANYLYICVATNTWRRTAHATW